MIDIDLQGQTSEELEGNAQLPSGWYMARVLSTHTDQKTGALKVLWKIESPPWAGATINDTFNLPALAMTQDQVPKLVRRLGLFLYRMGLVSKEDMGKRLQLDQAKLVGIQRVLELKREPSQDTSKGSREYTNVQYGAYWSTDRPEIPPVERVRLGLQLLPGQVLGPDHSTNGKPAPAPDRADMGAKAGTSASAPFDPSEV